MKISDISIEENKYNLLAKFERIPTMENHSPENCSCEKVEIFHSICIRDSGEIFCFQVCKNENKFVAHVNENGFSQCIGKTFLTFLDDLARPQ